jgi:hypothetical protein
MEKRILIGTPFCDEKSNTLEEFIYSLKEISVDINCDIIMVENSKPGNVPKYKELIKSKGFIYSFLTAEKTMDRVVLSRQKIIDYALNNSYSHVFFVDSDVILAKEQFMQMISTDKEVLSAVCLTIGNNGFPQPVPKISETEHMKLEDFQTGIKKFHKIGFGCVIIRTDLFEYINIRCERDSNNKVVKGEDYCFSEDALHLGHELYVDTNIQAKHIMSDIIDWNNS